MNRLTVVLVATFVTFMIVSGVGSYLLLHRSSPAGVSTATPQPVPTASPQEVIPGSQPSPATQNNRSSRTLLSDIFRPEESDPTIVENAGWATITARSTLRFSLAALLAVLLALRPRRGMTAIQRNPYVAQTQILLAVVAAAMMMIVGDSTARAFGIFAAASVINFRTNIRDPKEITILLICLGVGLACGVGRWELAVMLTLFVLLTLWILEYFEPAQVFRAMEVQVATRNVEQTHEVLKQIFARHNFTSELRQLNREDEDDPMGIIVYCVNLNSGTSTDRLSDEILAADPQNIDSVEWDQKKNTTYVYS